MVSTCSTLLSKLFRVGGKYLADNFYYLAGTQQILSSIWKTFSTQFLVFSRYLQMVSTYVGCSLAFQQIVSNSFYLPTKQFQKVSTFRGNSFQILRKWQTKRPRHSPMDIVFGWTGGHLPCLHIIQPFQVLAGDAGQESGTSREGDFHIQHLKYLSFDLRIATMIYWGYIGQGDRGTFLFHKPFNFLVSNIGQRTPTKRLADIGWKGWAQFHATLISHSIPCGFNMGSALRRNLGTLLRGHVPTHPGF